MSRHLVGAFSHGFSLNLISYEEGLSPPCWGERLFVPQVFYVGHQETFVVPLR